MQGPVSFWYGGLTLPRTAALSSSRCTAKGTSAASSIVYQRHPSSELNRLFGERPFQGAVPEDAEVLFVGLDANYSAGLDGSPAFPSVLEYHRDGVSFWRRHGVHHPFLLPAYRGDGRRYHLNFARIGFTPQDAKKISFVELLHVPTVGRSQLDVGDLDHHHLQWIDALVTADRLRHVFLSAGVLRLMFASRRFSWLQPRGQSADVLPVLYAGAKTKVYLHLHFSNYGKFQAQLEREALAIGRLARTDLGGA
jgi:hypothetical protein